MPAFCYCKGQVNSSLIECCGVPERRANLCPGRRWFHFKCLNFDIELASKYINKFYCKDCSLKYKKKTEYYNKYKSLMTDNYDELRPKTIVSSTSNSSQLDNEDNNSTDSSDDTEVVETRSVSDNDNNDDSDDSINDAFVIAIEGNIDEETSEDNGTRDLDDNEENNSSNIFNGRDNGDNDDENDDDTHLASGCDNNSNGSSANNDTNDWHRVEKLVKVGWDDNTNERMWLVRWEGYTSKEDTWFLESRLSCCKDMIDAEARKLNLPPSKLRNVHGCNIRETAVPVNVANWVTSTRVIEIIRMFKAVPQYKSDIPIVALDDGPLDKLPDQDTVYLVSLECHLYVVYCLVLKRFAWISDGLGLAFKESHVVSTLAKRLKMQLKPINCRLQKKADHCGASAAAITLEMIRLLKNPTKVLDGLIEFPHATYEKLVDKLHHGPSVSHSGWQPIHTLETRRYCQYCKTFSVSKNADRRILFMHQRKCKDVKRT